jgi:pilus assembly protein CpaC
VELADGESFMIGGLLDKTTSDTFQKIPFIGDIPILGKLFQSELRTKNDSELIIIVTPEIVAPFSAGTTLPTPHYPVAFLPPNSNIPMHQPDGKTPENTPAPSPTSVPVETLIQSLKPEQPLVIESGTGGFGQGGAAINAGTANGAAPAASSTPQQ